ncbi:probable Probable squalene synthase [Cephalotrichum gorgonifer]|uniref:Squalene synthase n=1 Tax=Cephalotrichum gorgonifer TaxID=2041049 RepID=A0AAE8MXT1_9PEZI|nr:probable Probable squalene synthase [Cephalotrichum gorgonifer]
MGALYFLLHPNQLKAVIQWKLWHEPVHKRNPATEAPTLQSCFKFLDLTSRSFSAVIQELNPELLVPITLFYLVLRGLDTIEDDLTIDLEKKEPLLRKFNEHMIVDGWTFDGNGPDEKDRELLVHFDDVVVELKKIKKEYFDIINDITIQMGNGMADYALNAEFNTNGVASIKDYEKYCHYVAGLVGDGLTRIFVQAQLANDRLLQRPNLTESMGQFLQKTNIIRDIREDFDVGRRWWPKEIWSQYADSFPELMDPKNRTKAVQCLNHMVLNSLKHVEECLFYMAAIRDQSVFNFVAIPQSMAIATLELCFNNPTVFDKNVKITKGDACNLMTQSTQNLQLVCQVFKKYVRRIHQKNDPRDPNYLAISLQCGRIEQFIETVFPRQTPERALKSFQNKDMAEMQGMDVWDGLMLMAVVVGAMIFIAALMIGAAYVANIYFTKWYPEDTIQLGQSVVSNVVQEIVHEEL